jgi:hypothetical protein
MEAVSNTSHDRRKMSATRILAGASLLLVLATGSSEAQPQGVRLTDGVRPPTRAFPGAEIEMTVFDPRLFPQDGTWTIAERPVRSIGPAAADGTYRLAFSLPAVFDPGWDRLPIVYADRTGRVVYDSRRDDSRDAVDLADIADPTPFLGGSGRLTGATPRASPGDRVCVCGLFPNRRSWEGLRLDGAPLGTPVTASGSELWFEIPDDLAPGVNELTGDPAAGFTRGDRATIQVLGPQQASDDDAPPCPCAASSAFLTDWPGSTVIPETREETGPRPAPDRPAQAQAAGGTAAQPLLWIEALGGSTGEVIKVHLVNPGPEPIEIDGYVALEPVDLSPEERDRIMESVRQTAGNHVEVNANFYCLQFRAAAPPQGVVFRIAAPAKQELFLPAARALDTARRLYEAGLLSPDTNPESYFHSIRQWSVWTIEQGFDHDRFLEAFLEHTKKNVEAAGQRWTDAIADVVRRSAEGRWNDITKILGEAGVEIPGTTNR